MSVSRGLLVLTLAACIPVFAPAPLSADTFLGVGGHALLDGSYKGYGLSACAGRWGDHVGVIVDLDATWPDVARWRPLALASPRLLVGIKRGDLYPHLYAGVGGGLARGVGFEEDRKATSYEYGVGLVRRGLRLSVGLSSIGLEDLDRSQHVVLRITLGLGRGY
jgi:hypothetical protein